MSTDRPAAGILRDRAVGFIAFAALLGLLYFGRAVLIPLALALMLSLLVAPLVRRLRRIGMGQTSSVLAAVFALGVVVAAAGGILGSQVLRVATSLPQYESTIRQKLHNLDELTVGRLDDLTSEARRLLDSSSFAAGRPAGTGEHVVAPAPPAVAVQEPRATPLQALARLLASVWEPVESAGIVLVVLVFVLLEHESLRDRFIHLTSGTSIQLTTLALNDAGERLSRYFVSQLAVNVGLGVAVGIGLAALGLPQAALWGALATLLRFVPYLGVWIAASLATALALAVDPGWSLAIYTLALFLAVELVVGQVVEPNLYGHTTGLSPLAVVVAAIFWSALWGPIGLVLSTPLTLCVLVIGRYIPGLRFLELLLADTQALSLPQKFYQRALSGDADEILRVAKEFLKRNTFAVYCDMVLLPALHLAYLDFEAGAIGTEQQLKLREVLVAVVATLSGEPRRLRRERPSVLAEQNPGQILRRHREQLTGKWQGPVRVPRGSILLCLALGQFGHIVAAELLARALMMEGFDARHISLDELELATARPGADPAAVAIVYLVSAFPSPERERYEEDMARLRARLPDARIVTVFLPGVTIPPVLVPEPAGAADYAVHSFAQAVQICLDQRRPAGTGAGTARSRAA